MFKIELRIKQSQRSDLLKIVLAAIALSTCTLAIIFVILKLSNVPNVSQNDEYPDYITSTGLVNIPDLDKIEKEFVFDWASNKTAIIDLTHSLCFLMKLNRTGYSPPHTPEAINNVSNSVFNMTYLRETKVIGPKVMNGTESFVAGELVAKRCRGLIMYWIEEKYNYVEVEDDLDDDDFDYE